MGQQQTYQLIGRIIRKHLSEPGYKIFIFGSRYDNSAMDKVFGDIPKFVAETEKVIAAIEKQAD